MSKQLNQRSRKKPGNGNGGRRPASARAKKFHPLSSNIKPSFGFDTVRDTLVDHMGAISTNINIDDMQESIRVGKLIVLTEPTLTLSSETDASLKAQQDIKATTTYREEIKSYTYRSNNLRYNQTSVRSIIMTKFITAEMEEKLRNEIDFETKLKDPIEMLNRIERS